MADVTAWAIALLASGLMAKGMDAMRYKTLRSIGREAVEKPALLLVVAALLVSTLTCYRFSIFAQKLLASMITMLLLGIAYIDRQTMIIPNRAVCLLMMAACSYALVEEMPFWHRVLGFFLISVPMDLTLHIVKDCFGGGDIKLMAAAGFLLGWQRVLLAFFIAVGTGGIFACWLLVTKRCHRNTHIAFGPHLCCGIILSLYAGWDILDAYLGLLLL